MFFGIFLVIALRMNSQTKILLSISVLANHNQLMSVFSLIPSKKRRFLNISHLTLFLNKKTLLNSKCHSICHMFSWVIRHSCLSNPNNTVWEWPTKSFIWLTTAMKTKKIMNQTSIGNYWFLKQKNQSSSKIICKLTWQQKSMKSTFQNLKKTFVWWCHLSV